MFDKAAPGNKNSVGGNASPSGLAAVVVDQLESGECIHLLNIWAHGNPSGVIIDDIEYTIPSTADETESETANVISETNAAYWIKQIKKTACFCKPCRILVSSCHTGLNGPLNDILAKESGCTVYAPKGYVHGCIDSKDPEGSTYVSKSKSIPGSDTTLLVTPPPTEK